MEVPDGIVTGLGGAGGSAAAAGDPPGAGTGAAAGFAVGELATAEVWPEGTPVWSGLGTLAEASGGAGFSLAPMGDEGGAETE